MNSWKSTKGLVSRTPLLRDQFRDLEGYKMRITQMGWFPLIGYTVDSDEISSTVTPLDTLHVRILNAVAGALNFTYEMRIPWDCQWGVSTPSGNWTGIIGTLQHHKSDFGMSITYNIGRMKVVDYTRILLKEPVIMVMSKPRPPPPYLAIIYPFTAELWAAVVVSFFVGGLILWTLQLAWKGISGEQVITFGDSSLHSFGGLMGQPAATLPTNTSGLMILAFWWIYCLLMNVTYKSSLIAHLSVPGKSKAIDSFDEMLRDPGWTWGYADTHSGTYDLFRKSDNPVIHQVFEGMEIQPNDQQVERILKEKHVLIIKEFLFKSLKSAIARSRRGPSPFYFGKSEYFANGDGWTFRQNAPFFDAIDMKLQQLTETGHITHWLRQLIGTSPDDICDGSTCEKETEAAHVDMTNTESSRQVVLSLNHLQSAFYLLGLGVGLAALVFVGENIFFMIK
ncbi:probable glutamate receptor isoform X1 [Palaemon carinicauda]|uniref:probable glutamate receptor isoform X1 n=2 Tax=Palaemon carinicauda TaxID=392227 RepID=UPI0035B66924